MSALLQSLSAGFDSLALRDAAGLGPLRRDALDRALAGGLPGTRAERWKYTSLRALDKRAFFAADGVDAAAIDGSVLPPAPRLVFANGQLMAELSDLSGLPDGVSFGSLSGALQAEVPAQLAFLARRFDADDEVFARLNLALATEGALLRVAPGVHCEQPLHVVLIGVPDGADRAHALRHLIELGDGAELAVVEHRLAVGEHANFANELIQLQLGEDARLKHLRVQAESPRATQVLRTDVGMATRARYQRLDLELGAGLSRHELNLALHGAGAQVHANGVLLGDGQRHLDTRLGIEHIARDTVCTLQWRGLAAQSSHVVFHGGILIRPGADGTDARLSNKNLLLSDQAAIDTQPVLEIHADEVQAAHGATVGNLDPMALFYLRSRGLPEAQAQGLLTAAFCREVLAVVQQHPALHDVAESVLDARLESLT
ncbi:MAG TPA: Fe-S cluster assembly protein SufD [Chiayiivirga sp.]|nr:Fe-S cluster assembly protein SufD [Chiayiivirga sp.]